MIIAMSVLTTKDSIKTNYTFNVKALSFGHAISKVETMFHYYDRSIDVNSIGATMPIEEHKTNNIMTISKRQIIGTMRSIIMINHPNEWINGNVNVDVLTGL